VACDRIHSTLFAYARDLPRLGQREVEIGTNHGRHKREGRIARVGIHAGPVSLKVPDDVQGVCRGQDLDLWVIVVREIDPPAGEEAVEWILLSNLPAETLEQASELIDWYCCRVVVEELHRAMKSGAGVEKLKFQSPQRIEPALALLSVISAMLLDLRHMARDPNLSRQPARAVVPVLWVQVLSGWRYQQVRDDLTVLEFVMALARLGGHLNRKGDGLPGWLTLWRGWAELQAMIRGAEAISRPRCV
jgi:hypothetical protein